jgi:hypothetical protein
MLRPPHAHALDAGQQPGRAAVAAWVIPSRLVGPELHHAMHQHDQGRPAAFAWRHSFTLAMIGTTVPRAPALCPACGHRPGRAAAGPRGGDLSRMKTRVVGAAHTDPRTGAGMYGQVTGRPRTTAHDVAGSLSPLSPQGLGLSPHFLGTDFLNGDKHLACVSASVPTVPTILRVTPTARGRVCGGLGLPVGAKRPSPIGWAYRFGVSRGVVESLGLRAPGPTGYLKFYGEQKLPPGGVGPLGEEMGHDDTPGMKAEPAHLEPEPARGSPPGCAPLALEVAGHLET